MIPPDLVGRTLDHVAIAVASLDAAAAYAALGWTADGPDELVAGQGVRVRLLRGGPGPALELLEPVDAAGPVGRFLARRGPGLHHLAFAVDDLDAEIARLQAAGARFVDPTPRPGRGGSRVVFVHPAWSGGVLVELVAHPDGHGAGAHG
jgi:methylmalonyl-CoA/ethylmalonyl-CoA epimerase